MKITILSVLACAVSSGFALGQTSIVQTLNFSGVPDFSAPMTFEKFHGNPADLLDVQITFTMNIDGGQFVVDNDSNTVATTTVNFGANLNASSSDVILLNASFNPIFSGASAINTQTFVLGANTGDGLNDYDPTGPDGGKLVGAPQSSTGGDSVNPAFWGGYTGAGTFNISANASQIGSLSYNSGIETATTPVTAGGTITVTYVVPEPSSVALSALAVIGFAFRRRRP